MNIEIEKLLRYKDSPALEGWKIARLFFSNGYGASIVKKPDGKYEVGTLQGDYIISSLLNNQHCNDLVCVEDEVLRITDLSLD